MKNAPIRLLVILGALTMIAMVLLQGYWITQAVDKQEEQFNRSVQMALRNVVESLCAINGNDIPSNNPIDQLSSNYFIARTNHKIDLASLDYLLQGELEKYQIDQSYEFGVYDCQTDRMVYGDFVDSNPRESAPPKGQLPKLSADAYYFGIYFPGKKIQLVNSLGLWKITAVLSLLLLIIFSYALFVILRQKRLSEIQRDFINNMTHEFKTPLATLQVSADMLTRESTDLRLRKYAQIVQSETRRLHQHVDQMLEVSLADGGVRTIRHETVDLGSLTNKVVARFQEFTHKHVLWLAPANHIYVSGDPHTLETIIFNLIDNAVKYGHELVEVSIGKQPRWVLLSVTNDGPAIPRAEQKKIFRRFYRISAGNRHDVRGFGLGLYFVKKAIKQHRGKVKVHSAEDRTMFTLYFPQ